MTDKMVDAASDERTANNTMRHQYRVLSDDEKKLVTAIKDTGLDFLNLIDTVGDDIRRNPRELALARTKIEEAVMWAVKAVTA